MPFGIVACSFSDNLSRNSCISYGFWLSRSCFQPVITVRAVMEELVMKKEEETTAVNVEVAGLENDVK